MSATDGNSVLEKREKMITLIGSEGERFDVTEAAAGLSQTIAHIIDDDCVEHGVPLPVVESKILVKVIEYCNKHVVVVETASDSDTTCSSAATSDQAVVDLKRFDAKFIKVDREMLFNIILAANYLNIKGLLDLTCQAVADSIKDKSVEEVRQIFNIVNDFTPKEEEKIRNKNTWAFE